MVFIVAVQQYLLWLCINGDSGGAAIVVVVTERSRWKWWRSNGGSGGSGRDGGGAVDRTSHPLVNLLEDQPSYNMKVVAMCALRNLVMYIRTNKGTVAEAGRVRIPR
ncbi:hypothetical protein Tco_1026938 [Tanacetum coccineum]